MATKGKLNCTQIEILGEKIIHVGSDLSMFIAEDLMKALPNIRVLAVVTDVNLERVHLFPLLNAFKASAGITSKTESETNPNGENRARFEAQKNIVHYVIPAGECSKSLKIAEELCDFLLSKGCNRDTCLIALGGGVIGDLVGFVASIYLRGIPFVQIPTTLLAMVDSSIGGKNGVDTPRGKNLIGTTYQPMRIYVDLHYLQTLPTREFSNGMAEIIKSLALVGQQQFSELENNANLLADYMQVPQISSTPARIACNILLQIIIASIKFKAKIVSEDVGDTGKRQLLNFGHTIGHGLEHHYTPYLLHGECVSIGIILEVKLTAVSPELCSAMLDRLKPLLRKFHLPISLEDPQIAKLIADVEPISMEELLRNMRLDKKNASGQIHVVHLADFGTPSTKALPVADNLIRSRLAKEFAAHPSINSRTLIRQPQQLSEFSITSTDSIKLPHSDIKGQVDLLKSIIIIGGVTETDVRNCLGLHLANELTRNYKSIKSTEELTAASRGYVISVVETDLGLNVELANWQKSFGMVINVITAVVEDDELGFENRQVNSNFSFYFNGTIGSRVDVQLAVDQLKQLVQFSNGDIFKSVLPSPSKLRSFFLTIVMGDVREILDDLPSMISGTDAVELRIDLLRPITSTSQVTLGYFERFVAQQICLIRNKIPGHPIIYTIRTKKEGGHLDTQNIDESLLFGMFTLGIRLGCEYIDLQIFLNDEIPVGRNGSTFSQKIIEFASNRSRIIASYHSISSPLDWTSSEIDGYIRCALKIGDIVKLVSISDSQSQSNEHNQKLEEFIETYQLLNTGIPLMALNMGINGRPTRISNTYMTPVTHPILSPNPSLGQISISEIFKAIFTLNPTERTKFFIFGYPVSHSLSPILHNSNFQNFQLPFTFELKETLDVEVIRATIRNPNFGGGSVTMPLKETVIPLLDEISPCSAKLRAVNTIVVQKDGQLLGENTDWIGIQNCVRTALRNIRNKCDMSALSTFSAVVLGAGGTARAAIYALQTLGLKKTFLYNRTFSKLASLLDCIRLEDGSLPLETEYILMESMDENKLIDSSCPLLIIVDATPMSSNLCSNAVVNSLVLAQNLPLILVRLAYSGMIDASNALRSEVYLVSGVDILIEQGLAQAKHWTGLLPDANNLRAKVQKEAASR